jgi:hypothetical protein
MNEKAWIKKYKALIQKRNKYASELAKVREAIKRLNTKIPE